MKGRFLLLALALALDAQLLLAQEEAATATPYAQPAPSVAEPAPPTNEAPPKKSWLGRVMHPFGGSAQSQVIKDPKLKGLVLDLQIAPQPVKLSETRLLEVKLTATNRGKKTVNFDFSNEQRIEIYLMNSGGVVLTKWSENHAFKDKPGTLLINPQEHVEYNEKISTRELAPDKVYIAEVFFPKYPELRVRQKFMTAP
jgi:Intracellular proteinase inhibitor